MMHSGSCDEWSRAQARVIEELKTAVGELIRTGEANSGAEPSVSCWQRAVDRAAVLAGVAGIPKFPTPPTAPIQHPFRISANNGLCRICGLLEADHMQGEPAQDEAERAADAFFRAPDPPSTSSLAALIREREQAEREALLAAVGEERSTLTAERDSALKRCADLRKAVEALLPDSEYSARTAGQFWIREAAARAAELGRAALSPEGQKPEAPEPQADIRHSPYCRLTLYHETCDCAGTSAYTYRAPVSEPVAVEPAHEFRHEFAGLGLSDYYLCWKCLKPRSAHMSEPAAPPTCCEEHDLRDEVAKGAEAMRTAAPPKGEETR